MVAAGVASTLVPVVALNPVPGDHEYEFAPIPPAVNVVVSPSQIVTSGLRTRVGVGSMLISAVAVAVHPLLSPVTV